MPVEARVAATVMLLRDSGTGLEVFMVRRVVQSEFMPDVFVFPGGSIINDDHAAEQTAGACMPVPPSMGDPQGHTALGSGLRVAAIRELFEEANVLLAYNSGKILSIQDEQTIERFRGYRQAFNERRGSLLEMADEEQLVFATERLNYFAHWITPEMMPKRYDTHFFLAAAPEEQEALYDNLETSAGLWIGPEEALERFRQQTFPIAFPTYHQLRDLAAFRSVEQALKATATRHIPTHLPKVTRRDGVVSVYLPDAPEQTWRAQGGN